jgi:hypothetical protein
MKTKFRRYLADYAGSGLVFGAFLIVALAVCSLASAIETLAARSAAGRTPSMQISTR